MEVYPEIKSSPLIAPSYFDLASTYLYSAKSDLFLLTVFGQLHWQLWVIITSLYWEQNGPEDGNRTGCHLSLYIAFAFSANLLNYMFNYIYII